MTDMVEGVGLGTGLHTRFRGRIPEHSAVEALIARATGVVEIVPDGLGRVRLEAAHALAVSPGEVVASGVLGRAADADAVLLDWRPERAVTDALLSVPERVVANLRAGKTCLLAVAPNRCLWGYVRALPALSGRGLHLWTLGNTFAPVPVWGFRRTGSALVCLCVPEWLLRA